MEVDTLRAASRSSSRVSPVKKSSAPNAVCIAVRSVLWTLKMQHADLQVAQDDEAVPAKKAKKASVRFNLGSQKQQADISAGQEGRPAT